MANARAANSELVAECGQCSRSLFASVVRCPYCGVRRSASDAPDSPITDVWKHGAPTEVIEVPRKSPIEEDKSRRKATSQAPRTGISKGAMAVSFLVLILVVGLWLSDVVRSDDGKPQIVMTVDSEWQPLEVPPGARIVANGPFRLRTGPDLYAIPLNVGVAVPAPVGDEPLMVRAAAGAVRLEVYY